MILYCWVDGEPCFNHRACEFEVFVRGKRVLKRCSRFKSEKVVSL